MVKSKKRLDRERIENELKQAGDDPQADVTTESNSSSSESLCSSKFSDASESDSEIADSEADKCNTMEDIHKLMERKKARKTTNVKTDVKFENTPNVSAGVNFGNEKNTVSDLRD